MTNIKNIGKELLGKSLNSYHRRTGLSQLEKNNEMQDGILNGILSQVDDAYIEKTEQSNVIHLDGSGDGVVVVDSIEGNTLVNLGMSENFNKYNMIMDGCKFTRVLHSNKHYGQLVIPMDKLSLFKSDGKYKIITNITKNTLVNSDEGSQKAFQLYTFNYSNHAIESSTQGVYSLNYDCGEIGIKECVVTMKDFNNPSYPITQGVMHFSSSYYAISGELEGYIIICEYNEDIVYPTTPFNGLQSSFEEQVEDDKYKIEILSQNAKTLKNPILIDGFVNGETGIYTKPSVNGQKCWVVECSPNTTYSIDGWVTGSTKTIGAYDIFPKITDKATIWNYVTDTNATSATITTTNDSRYLVFMVQALNSGDCKETVSLTPHNLKQNKIKLLINEPLRAIGDVKDRLCIKDNKLVVERNCGSDVLNGEESWNGMSYGGLTSETRPNTLYFYKYIDNLLGGVPILSDKFANVSGIYSKDTEGIHTIDHSLNNLRISINKSKLLSESVTGLKQWLSENFISIIYQLAEPCYEEVLNEYGEPIILEGYENGTLYVDSTIAPTTSIKYTPNMKSINTLKEVSNNNIMLTNDISDTIIPYMMEVDLMIMEKEMSLFNSLNKNIRKMEVLDMTSMQKRTGEMLERLIKGKSLNEQECKTRVTVYLNAGKITDEQAEELMLLISEIYA